MHYVNNEPADNSSNNSHYVLGNDAQEKYMKLLERADILLGDGKFDEARQYYNLVLNEKPRCSGAYVGLYLASANYKSFDNIKYRILNPTKEQLEPHRRSLETVRDPQRCVAYDIYEVYNKFCYENFCHDKSIYTFFEEGSVAQYSDYGIHELNTKFYIDYFFEERDINEYAYYGGEKNDENAMIGWLYRCKAWFIDLWKQNDNLRHARDFATPDEAQLLALVYDDIVEAIDAEIERNFDAREEAYEKKRKSKLEALNQQYNKARKLKEKFHKDLDTAQKMYDHKKYVGAYKKIQPYERHPDAKKLMREAYKAEQDRVNKPRIFTAIASSAIMLAVGIVLTILSYNRDFYASVSFFSLIMLLLFAVGILTEHLVDKHTENNVITQEAKEIGIHLTKDVRYIFSVSATVIAVIISIVFAVLFEGAEEFELVRTLALLIPTLPMIVYCILNAVSDDKVYNIFISAIFFAGALLFVGFPMSLIDPQDYCVLDFGGDEELWTNYENLFMPILYVLTLLTGIKLNQKLPMLIGALAIIFDVLAMLAFVVADMNLIVFFLSIGVLGFSLFWKYQMDH